MSNKTHPLSEILQEIRNRRIVFDEEQVLDWLFDYACKYRSLSGEDADAIMYRKGFQILKEADKVYWDTYRQVNLWLDKEMVERVAEDDYKDSRKLLMESSHRS